MNEQDLKRVAREFREGILEGQSSHLWCFAVSSPLAGYLHFLSQPCELVEGKVYRHQHFWIELPDGTILDATADQFETPDGKPMPKVYIGKKPSWYKHSQPLTGHHVVDKERLESEKK